jgi:uncharacterized membrane protein required for colicin V production
MSTELIIFLVALLPIALRAVLGWRTGATFELRHTLVYLFSLLAALRYWKPGTVVALQWVSADPQIVSAIVFLLIYLAAALLSGFIVNLKGAFYQSVAPNKLDNALGALCGMCSGALLGGVIMLLCAFVVPGKVETFDTAKFPARLDQLPVWVYQTMETKVARIPLNSAARTQFPVPPGGEVRQILVIPNGSSQAP